MMTPRFVFWECKNCEQSFLDKDCFGGGKYCAASSNLTGQEIVLEDLRQMCIYKKAYSSDETRKQFWLYIQNVHDECGTDLNEDCSKYAHQNVEGLDWAETEECVKNSFSSPNKADWTKNTTKNSLIDKDIWYWSRYGSNVQPSIVINNSTYRGQLET